MTKPPQPAPPKKAEPAPRGYGAALAVFAAVWLVLCWPWLSGRVVIPWDGIAHFFPQFFFLAKSLAAGDSPFWTPNIYDGWPQIADPQSLIFAPTYLLAALLDPSPSFRMEDAVIFATLGLGACGLLLYFRDRRWRAEGALLAALAFAFGGSAAWRIQHIGQVMSLAWFPLAYFALARALDRGSFVWGALAGVFAGLMALGRDQVGWFFALFLAAWVVMRALSAPGLRANARRFARPLAGGFVAGALVVAAPLAFTLALALDSNRPSIVMSEVVKASLHPASLLTFVVPDLYAVKGPLAYFWGPPSQAFGVTDLALARNMGEVYIGALALAALIASGFGLRRGDRDAKFMFGAVIALLLYALGRYTPAFALLYRLPGADLWRRPADATFPLCALLAYLAGYGLHRLIVGEMRWRPACVALALAGLLAACAAMAVWKDRLAQANGPLSTALVFLAVAIALLAWLTFHARLRTGLALVLIGLFCTADFAIGSGPNESTALPAARFDMLAPNSSNTTIALLRDRLAREHAPDRRDRVEFAGIGFDWPNASLVQGFDQDLGYNPLRLSLFQRFSAAEDIAGLPEQRTFSKAFPSYRSIAADLTGLRYIATGVPVEQIDKAIRPGDLVFVARTADGYVYENPRAMPRVFVATSAQIADFDAILDRGAWPQVDYRTTVLLKSGGDQKPRREGAARLVSYRNADIEIDANAPDGGWLVLTDVFHPWWECRIDGTPAPIEQADVLFRAVALPPGGHRVSFRFRPFAGLRAQIAAALASKPRGP
ncbi:MAG: hypothetical protein KGM42_18245 [Hyphomicrobiales bacterium]|nr:hypothetical protein [Hyphomicrobiales bacterium]